jgi:hypothetical protein
MKALAFLAVAFISSATPSVAQQKARSHASREAAIELLRHKGILHGKTRVDSATWSRDFWIISLRHFEGKITNWTVDAKAQNYSYACSH